jgi:hypothetical protein
MLFLILKDCQFKFLGKRNIFKNQNLKYCKFFYPNYTYYYDSINLVFILYDIRQIKRTFAVLPILKNSFIYYERRNRGCDQCDDC